MEQFRRLQFRVKAYVGIVVLVGSATFLYSLYSLYAHPIGSQWLLLAGLTLLTGSFTVKVPSVNAHISVSETFVFASVLLFGPAAGAITVLLECLIILFWMKPQGRPIHRILFNLAAPSVAIWASAQVFFLVSGFEPYIHQPTSLSALFFPLVVFTSLYFLLNSGLVAVVVGLETGQPPITIWWNNFFWLSVNYFSGASVAALIVTYAKEFDLSVLAIIVPLLTVSYLTFRTAMGRVEDTTKHLTELNRLHLSTIETLAMAIDAKDQITHGHIRRVQTYAVGLARRVGIVDEKLIKAIEAAALLHDMGKLAVPEYILNKPGKLTKAEFEKMKIHASVGADILSAIEFPYPVVPIVRHHHENWDGSGYPAGLRGTDIPIGARILSVVDCFDALTSDRPYRPRLANDKAIEILINRRGSMYDPLMVDTFIMNYAEILPEYEHGDPVSLLRQSEPPVGQSQADNRSDLGACSELFSSDNGHSSMRDVSDSFAAHVKRLVPCALVIVFLYDDAADEIFASQVVGEGENLARSLRMSLGQRLSGWVAANRQTIVNSDAALDVGDILSGLSGRFGACLSTPIVANEQLIGVLSLYSSNNEQFTDGHQLLVESAARSRRGLEQFVCEHLSASDRRTESALQP